MKKQLSFIVSCIISLSLWSQSYDPGKVDKKAKALYDKGLELAQDGYYPQALEQLQEAIKKDPKFVDAYLSLAGVYGQIKNYAACVLNYEKAFSLDPEYTLDFKLPYSINLAG